MSTSVVLTGAHVAVLVNGVPLGIATSFEVGRRITRRRIQGVDQVTPSELAIGAVTVVGQIGLVYPQRSGGAEGAGLVAPTDDLVQEQYVTIELRDLFADVLVFRILDAAIVEERWSSPIKDVLTGTLSFEGLTLLGAVRPRNA